MPAVRASSPSPPLAVPERDGPWDAFTLPETAIPELRSSLPLTFIYRHDGAAWVPRFLAGESALLLRAGAPSGMGLYTLVPLRGPRELERRSMPGDTVGYYGGAVVESAATQVLADAAMQSLVREGQQYLVTLRVAGHLGWHVVDGCQQPVLPWLHYANDPRGTPFAPRCLVSDYGKFTAARDIPALDLTRPLRDQAASELSWEYGEGYWRVHESLGSRSQPFEFL